MPKTDRNKLRLHRKKRIKIKNAGLKNRPRLSVFRSLRGIYAQVIDDSQGIVLASASLKKAKAKNNLEGAKKVGEMVAKASLAKKIEKVFFDQAGYKYHGKVKALAEGARSGGLKF